MASISTVESIATSLASSLKLTVKTKFSTNESGYAATNGSFTNGERYNILQIDDSSQYVVQCTSADGTSVCEVAVPSKTVAGTVATKAANAWKAVR